MKTGTARKSIAPDSHDRRLASEAKPASRKQEKSMPDTLARHDEHLIATEATTVVRKQKKTASRGVEAFRANLRHTAGLIDAMRLALHRTRAAAQKSHRLYNLGWADIERGKEDLNSKVFKRNGNWAAHDKWCAELRALRKTCMALFKSPAHSVGDTLLKIGAFKVLKEAIDSNDNPIEGGDDEKQLLDEVLDLLLDEVATNLERRASR